MKIRKFLPFALFALCLTACGDDNEPNDPESGDTVRSEAYIICEGSYYYNIPGSVVAIDLEEKTATPNAFKTVNGRVLGDTPQSAIIHGSKMYIAVSESNRIEVVDASTLKSIDVITPEQSEGQQPRWFAAQGNKVYVSMYDGKVARIDTTALVIDNVVNVGPNPEQVTIAGNYLYVANSDGMNYLNGYADGKSVSKINLSTFEVEKEIAVGVNPQYVESIGDDVYVVCTGDYYSINPTLYKISTGDTVESLFEASAIAVNGDKIYVVYSPMGAYTGETIGETQYFVYSTSSKTKTSLNLTDLANPSLIFVNPSSGNIFVGSYASMTDYNSATYVNEYTADGTFVAKYTAATGTPHVVF